MLDLFTGHYDTKITFQVIPKENIIDFQFIVSFIHYICKLNVQSIMNTIVVEIVTNMSINLRY